MDRYGAGYIKQGNFFANFVNYDCKILMLTLIARTQKFYDRKLHSKGMLQLAAYLTILIYNPTSVIYDSFTTLATGQL